MWLLALTIAVQTVTIEDPAYGEAMRLVEEFEYERAVFRFREALRHDHELPQRALIELQLGITYAELGEEKDAVERFADALGHDGRVNLPSNASPKTQELFAAGRQALADREKKARDLEEMRTKLATFEAGKKPKEDTPQTWDAHDPTLAYIGAGTAVVGALLIAGGIGAQLNAIDLHQQGVAAAFQDDAARLGEASTQGQVLAYSLLGAGGGLALVGGALVFIGE